MLLPSGDKNNLSQKDMSAYIFSQCNFTAIRSFAAGYSLQAYWFCTCPAASAVPRAHALNCSKSGLKSGLKSGSK